MYTIFVFLLILFFIDKICVRYVNDSTTRWYLLHIFINFYVTTQVFTDVLFVLKNPLISIETDYDITPLMSVVALHLYHFKDYKKLLVVDWVHHLANALLLGLLPIYFPTGMLTNYCLFFVCGLPGLVDYIMLTCVKFKIIKSLTEKYYNTILNTWLRVPGLLNFCFIAYMCKLYNKTTHSWLFVSLYMLFISINALYFQSRVIYNYAVKSCYIPVNN